MNYEIKPLKYENLDRIYPEAEKEAIGRIITEKHLWPKDMYGGPWAVDEQTNVFLAYMPSVRLDSAFRYLFGMPGGVAVIRAESYCLYSFLYVSPGLRHRMDEVKDRIRDVFKTAGELIDGTTNADSSFSVPNAQFKD